MDDGEVDFSNHEMFSNSDLGDFPNSCSMNTFLDEILNDSHACTHTHTCNPPGPDSSHTHTCFHVHTKIVPASADESKPGSDDTAESAENKVKKRRPLGNREAVRKYREKKKARAASLEDEIVRLRAMNQQLVKRLQGQAALEAEVGRLRCLLVDIRGRIDGEIGSFPYQKPAAMAPASVNPGFVGGYGANPCNIQCNDQLFCPYPGVDGRNDGMAGLAATQGFDGCDFEHLQCVSSPTAELRSASTSSSAKKKRKGGSRATNVTG